MANRLKSGLFFL